MIVDYLKKNTSITDLKIVSTRIDDDRVIALAENLGGIASLQSFLLNCSDIGPKGLEALATVLQDAISLKSLYLSWLKVNIDYDKFLIIFACISPEEFCLNYSEIEKDGAKLLATGLKHSTSLQSLDLSYTEIGIDGIIAIAEALN